MTTITANSNEEFSNYSSYSSLNSHPIWMIYTMQ